MLRYIMYNDLKKMKKFLISGHKKKIDLSVEISISNFFSSLGYNSFLYIGSNKKCKFCKIVLKKYRLIKIIISTLNSTK